MPQPLDDAVLTTFAVGTFCLSIAVGLYLIYAKSRAAILSYVPRRPVPWGPVATTLVMLYVVVALSTALSQPSSVQQVNEPQVANPDEREAQPNSWEVAKNLAESIVSQGFIVGGFAFVIALFYQATPRDLGMPASSHEFKRDVFIGAVAAVAALAPVLVMQGLLRYLMNMQGEHSGNPLIKTITGGEPNVTVMVLASFAAVVVAPICEETAFRLLLQGWLEKCEDRRLGWRAVSPPDVVMGDDARAGEEIAMTNDECRMPNVGLEESTNSSFVIRHSSLEIAPPQLGIAGLPYGWLPILISSVLFGLAHLGYGPEPVPLFFLALFLGYMYQRTHRIVPCIVCHALFNAFTMFVLWRMAFHGEHAQ